MKKTILASIIALTLIGVSCKKTSPKVDERVPPEMAFKTGGIYVSGDITTVKQDTLIIGIIVTKKEDALTSFNGSVSFDGSATTTTFFNHALTSNEYDGYSVDVPYYVRNQTGTEVLTFTIADRDGNITKKSITVTVH